MSEALSVIGRTVFELELEGVPQARAVQERISRFAQQRLAELLDAAVLAELAPEERVAVARIELDLGELDDEHLEVQLHERLGPALRAFLRRGAGLARRPAHPEEGALGRLAAWLEGAPGLDAQSVFAAALAEPDGVVALLRDLGRKHAVRRRLSWLPDAQISAVLAVLEPSDAPAIVALSGRVNAAHRERPLVPESRRGFAAAVWEFVFGYLLLQRGSYFNAKALTAHLLAGIAARYRVRYADLLAALASAAHDLALPAARAAELPAILRDLQGEIGTSVEEDGAGHEALAGAMAALSRFLRHGVWTADADFLPRRGFSAVLDGVLESDPERLAAFLRQNASNVTVRRRLAWQAAELQMHAIVRVLEPRHGEWIVATVGNVRAAQAQGLPVREDRPRFARRLWEFVLQALLVERGSHFNTLSFVDSLIAQMSASTGVAYGALLGALTAHTETALRGARPARLARVLHELAHVHARRGHGAPVLPDPVERVARRLLARAEIGNWDGQGGHARLGTVVRTLARRHGVAVERLIDELAREDGGGVAWQREAVGALLASLHTEWQQGASEAGGAERTPAPPFSGNLARAAREFAVRTVVLERGSWFNDRSYVHDLIERLAQRHGLSYGALLQALVRATGGAAGAARGTPLPALLRELGGAHDAAAEPIAARADHASMQAAAVLDGADTAALLYWRTGLLAGPGLAAAVRHGFSLPDRDRMLALMRDDVDGSIAARVADSLPPTAYRRLLDWMAPDLASLLATLAECGGAHARALRIALLAVVVQSRGARLDELLAEVGNRAAALSNIAAVRLWGHIAAQARTRGDGERYRVLAELSETRRASAAQASDARYGAADARAAAARAVAAASRSAARALRSADRVKAGTLAHALAALLAAGPQAVDFPDGAAALYAELVVALRRRPPELISLLRAACARPLERARLARLLPPALREAMLVALAGASGQDAMWWRGALLRVLPRLGPRIAYAAWAELIDEALLARLAVRSGGRAVVAYLRAAADAAWQDAALAPAALWDALDAELEQAAPAACRSGRRLLAHLRREHAAAPAPAKQGKLQTPEPESVPEDLPLSVANAGVVLAWPFLDRLFASLGLTEDGAFADPAQRMRAVHLLDYLACGRENGPEEEMALAKVLCGLDPAVPLEPGLPLSEAEKGGCAALLAAVIAHWSRLGNTTADGLRETFLCRRGELRRQEGNWQLRVPQQAFDILLTTLPWSIGTIRLSWMKGILWVSWK
ncbi:MAG TPA: contractile injection system tape measure protein [Telluria sp.]|nr:contractile injection system tape measure protein [Telluria sp.]